MNGGITVNGIWPSASQGGSDFALTEIAVVSHLLRHSSLDLTSKLYLQLGLRDLLAAVNRLQEL